MGEPWHKDNPSMPEEPDSTVTGQRPALLPEKYTILGTLGSGGMGMVLHAQDTVLDRQVAVKMISSCRAQNKGFVQRFLSEARAAARMNHPAIVQVYDFGQVDDCYYLVMEYVDGCSLGDDLKTMGRFTEQEAVNLAHAACLALGEAHSVGIVHRDVKPDNMMRNSKGEFKLVDLGLAKCLSEDMSQTRTGQSMGTPHYISPEQVMGAKNIDLRSDLYSLGATLYHLATGHFPFEGSSGPHVMARHLNDPLPDPHQYVPELSDGFCRIINKLMEKDPASRYQDTNSLDRDLITLLEGGMPAVEAPTVCILRETEDSNVAESLPAGDLDSIKSALALAIGPLARVLVNKTALVSSSRDELCLGLAQHIPGNSEREVFLKTTSTDTGSRVSSHSETLTNTVWSPEHLKKLETLLLGPLGPVAGILVRRESKRSEDLESLAESLADNILDSRERDSFLNAVKSFV